MNEEQYDKARHLKEQMWEINRILELWSEQGDDDLGKGMKNQGFIVSAIRSRLTREFDDKYAALIHEELSKKLA